MFLFLLSFLLSILITTGNVWPCSWPLLSQNSVSPPQYNNTRVIQSLLNELLKLNLTVDGLFGSATTSAVKMFQSNNKLSVDGAVGEGTWQKLLNFTVQPGDISAVKAVQILLGVDQTGILDESFIRAVKLFQTNRGINITGEVDPNSWHTLVSDCNSSLSTAVYGFDIGWPEGLPSEEHLSCVKGAGFSFAVFQVYTEGHQLWTEGITNILTAIKVGFPYVNAYHFPLRSQDSNAQVLIVTKALKAANAAVPRIWIDIEGSTWNSYTKDQNVAFVETLVQTYESEGYKVGIYCGREFPDFFGPYTGFSNLPVWYAHYDIVPSFVDWWGQPYGGWKAPSVKQFYDKSTGFEQKCNLTIDWDWSPSSFPFM